MRWSTRIALAVLGALIIALGVAWFLHTHERVSDTVDLPPRGEAAYNPLYALRETLRWKRGHFSFRNADLAPQTGPRQTIGGMLIEAMRLEDEARR